MLRKASEEVPEVNGPVPQKEELGSGQLTWGDVYRVMKVAFDRWDKKLDEISDEMRKMDQHVTRLEHGAWQPRLAMEADGQADTKTRERTEGAATAVQAMRGDCFSARRVVVVVVVSHIQRIGCQPEKNYFTRWPIPLVVC